MRIVVSTCGMLHCASRQSGRPCNRDSVTRGGVAEDRPPEKSGKLLLMDEFPGPIATSVSLRSAAVTVTHHRGAAIGSEPAAVVLRESNVVPDTLTRIQVWPYGKPASSVLVLWQRQPASEGVGVLLNDAADTLFVGAGTLAAAVRLETGDVVGSHDVFLFWSFQPCGNFVLELGELSCFLRSSAGEVLGEVPVDPPYELFQTAEVIRFESIVMGTHWLHFPKQQSGTGA